MSEMTLRDLLSNFLKSSLLCGLMLGLNTAWIVAQNGNEADSLLDAYEQYLDNPEALADSSVFQLYRNMGKSFRFSNPDTSLYFYDKSMEVFNESIDSVQLGWLYSDFFYIYYIQGEYDAGLDVARKAEEVFRKTDSRAGLARAYNNKGLIYAVLDDQEEAIQEYKRSLELNREIDRKTSVGTNFYNLGISYSSLEEYELARSYFDSSLTIHQELEDARMTKLTLTFLGEVYREQGLYEKALGFYQEAQKMAKDSGEWDKAFIYAGLSAAYAGLGNYKQAENYGLTSYNLAEKIEAKWELQRTARILADVYERQNKFEQALKYQKLYSKWNEDIFNEQRDQNINRIRLAEQKTRAAVLQAENLKNLQRIGEQEFTNRFLAAVVVGAVLIIAVIMFFLSRQRTLNQQLIKQRKQLIKSSEAIRHQKEALEQLNTTKDKILSIVSHDARAPLTNLSSLISILDDGYDDYENFRVLLRNIKNELSRTRDMFTNVMYWARTQFEAFHAEPETLIINDISDVIVRDFKVQSEQKQVELINNVAPDCTAYADSTLVMIVLRNFVSNAVKYTEPGDSITVSCAKDADHDGYVKISITDTGIGMTDKQIEKVISQENFTRRGTGNESGSGFGIMICRDMIDQMCGEFHIKSEPTVGTSIEILLPETEDVVAG